MVVSIGRIPSLLEIHLHCTDLLLFKELSGGAGKAQRGHSGEGGAH